jgi:hypothetical protein
MKPSELKTLLKYSFKKNKTVLIVGMPGIGKTDIVKQASKKYDLMIMHPVVDSPIDYKGLGGFVDGEAVFKPYGNLKRMMNAKKKLIVFLDDLGQATEAVQKALMQVLLAREINGVKISPHVVFVAATNRRGDKAGVNGVLEPVKSRFDTIVELEPNAEDWIKWAHKKKMPLELISYIQWRPHMIGDFEPTRDLTNSSVARTVANVGKHMLDKVPKEVQFETFKGAAGKKMALEFTGFLKMWKELPSFKEIIASPSSAKLPPEVSGKFAVMGMIVDNITADNMGKCLEYLGRLGNEVTTAAMQLVSVKKPEALANEAYVNWCVKHDTHYQSMMR